MPYTVVCIECGLRLEMNEVEDVLDFREEHKDEYGDQHHIEFQLVRSPAPGDDD